MPKNAIHMFRVDKLFGLFKMGWAEVQDCYKQKVLNKGSKKYVYDCIMSYMYIYYKP